MAKMKKALKQQIVATAKALAITQSSFSIADLKAQLPQLIFCSDAPKSREWRDVLDSMVTDGILAIAEQGESVKLGGTEGTGKMRRYCFAGQVPRTVIEQIIAKSEHNCYGFRAVPDHSKQYGFDYAPLKVGDIAPPSYEWDDNEPTDEKLGVTCAVDWRIGADKALNIALKTYLNSQIVLLGSYAFYPGPDLHEIRMYDPVVLAVWNTK